MDLEFMGSAQAHRVFQSTCDVGEGEGEGEGGRGRGREKERETGRGEGGRAGEGEGEGETERGGGGSCVREHTCAHARRACTRCTQGARARISPRSRPRNSTRTRRGVGPIGGRARARAQRARVWLRARVPCAHVPCARRAAVPRSACGRAVSRTGAGASVPHDAGHGANPPYTRTHARTHVERKPRAGSRARAGAGSSAPEVVRRKPRAGSCAPEAVHRKPRTGNRAPVVYFV